MAIQRNLFLEFLFFSYVFNGFCDGAVRIVGDEEIVCDGTKSLTLKCNSDTHKSARHWYFNKIGNHENLKAEISFESPHYTAVGSNTLSVNSFNQNDVGVYECDDGTYPSDKLTVKCSCEIEIKSQRTQYVVRRGSEVTLKFRIVERLNNDKVVHLSEWTKNNKNTASITWRRSDNVHSIIKYKEGERTVRNVPDHPYSLTSEDYFELHAVQKGINDGITSCVLDVPSSCVSKRIDYQLTVIEPPTLRSTPRCPCNEDTEGTIICPGSGEIMWKFQRSYSSENISIDGSGYDIENKVSESRLVFRKLNRIHDGTYWCERQIQDGASVVRSGWSKRFRFEVHYMPYREGEYNDHVVTKYGHLAVLEFKIDANPQPGDVIWKKLNNHTGAYDPITANSRITMSYARIGNTRYCRAKLVISNATEGDSGGYQAVVRNNIGSTTVSIHMTTTKTIRNSGKHEAVSEGSTALYVVIPILVVVIISIAIVACVVCRRRKNRHSSASTKSNQSSSYHAVSEQTDSTTYTTVQAKPESEYVNFAGKNSHQKKEEENVYSNQTGAKTGQSGDQKAGESEYANHTGTKPGTQVDTPGQKPFKLTGDDGIQYMDPNELEFDEKKVEKTQAPEPTVYAILQ